MHIAHVQGTLSPEHGGPTQSLANYCRIQANAGHRVSVWTLEGFPNTSNAIRIEPPVEMHVHPVSPPWRLGRSPVLRRELINSETADVYHLHGAWLRALNYGADEALCRKRPFIVELMGTYEPWSLRYKWLKKQLARWWFQDRLLNNAACLHVNSHMEAEHVRQRGIRRPIAVIPVGVDMSGLAIELAQVTTESPWSELDGRSYVLYLSRLHPKKRLDLLIRSWAAIAPGSADWRLVIAGAGEPAYIEKCQQLAIQLGIAQILSLAGPRERIAEELAFCPCPLLCTADVQREFW